MGVCVDVKMYASSHRVIFMRWGSGVYVRARRGGAAEASFIPALSLPVFKSLGGAIELGRTQWGENRVLKMR